MSACSTFPTPKWAGRPTTRWHVDEIFLQDPRPITLLHAQVLPSYGGDTAFISSVAAYEALSDRMKVYVDGLVAVFDYTKLAELSWVKGTGGAQKMAEYLRRSACSSPSIPVVRVHPVSGRQARSVVESHLSTLHPGAAPEREGLAHRRSTCSTISRRPEFAYRHQLDGRASC